MKIEANDKEVSDIFSLGYFKIPRFQRPYSWGDEEVNNFWDDVVVDNHEHYFIGSMVVYDIQKPYLGIVDGQQRLTTITLMLASIRNAFYDFGAGNLAKGVHNYIEKANIDNEDIFILDSDTAFPYMQSHIQSFSENREDETIGKVGTEELRLKKGFEIINKKLSNLVPIPTEYQKDLFGDEEAIKKLKEIRDKVLSLKLVFIQLDNEEDAYLIFETLNTRGRDLTTPDLVKNLLLKKLKGSQSRYDNPKIKWEDILKYFDNHGLESGMKNFLYHFWLSKFNYSTEQKLFGKISKYITSVELANEFLTNLKINAEYYVRAISPKSVDWRKEEENIENVLLAFKIFKVKQQIPMVFSLIRAYKEKKITLKEISKNLEKMESFHFIFNAVTSQRSSGSIHTFYSKHAISLSNSSEHSDIQIIFNELEKSLKNKIPDFNEFEVSFSNLVYLKKNTRNKNLIKYILAKVMLNQPSAVTINIESMTLEHLIPQSASNERDDEFIGSIGNLILVDAKTNSEDLKDNNFQEKKKILLDKQYPFDQVVLNADSWDIKTIKERTKYLCEIAYNKIWNIK